jgi:hypothetical protein
MALAPALESLIDSATTERVGTQSRVITPLTSLHQRLLEARQAQKIKGSKAVSTSSSLVVPVWVWDAREPILGKILRPVMIQIHIRYGPA